MGDVAMDDTLLEARGLSFAYREGRPVFTDVSFSLAAGETLTVLGPNGAGKSTLLDCLGGLLRPSAGEVLVAGEPLAGMGERRLSQILGYVSQLQEGSLAFPVRDYLVLGRAPHLGSLRTPSDEDYEAVEEAIARLGIERLAGKAMSQLSGGERQQVRIARILVQRPRVVMLDEPTNHLDYGNQVKVLETIARLADEEGMSVLLTTHTPDHAILLGGQAAILDRTGRLEVGPASRIVTEERLREIYDTDVCMVDVDRLGRKACVAGNLRRGRSGAGGASGGGASGERGRDPGRGSGERV